MTKIKLILLLLIIIPLEGCYNYKELNDLGITTAVGIDKIDNGYKVVAQLVNTEKSDSQSNNSSTKITVYTAEAPSLQEAFRNLILESPKKLYLNQLQILLISEDVASDGITNILDIIFRSVESRKQFYVLLTKDVTSLEVLQTLTPIDTVVSSNIKKSLVEDSNYLGVSELVTFEDLINEYLDNNIEISLPSVTVIGNSEEGKKEESLEESKQDARVILKEMAVFKKDKLLGYMSKEESIALSFIKNEISNTVVKYECEENKYVISRLISSKTKIKNKNNELQIDIEVSGNGNISEVHCDLNLESDKVIKEIENKTNKEIEKKITNHINNLILKYNSDIFGFLDLYYKNNYNYYKKIKDTWYENGLKNIIINVKSNIKLVEKGNSLRVVEDEK